MTNNKINLLKKVSLSTITTVTLLLGLSSLNHSVFADTIDGSNNLQSEDIKVKQADDDVTQVHNVTETIKYVYADGKEAAPSKITSLSFARIDIENKQNNVIVNPGGGWNARSQTFTAVKSPVISGYQADNEIIASQTVNPDSQDLTYIVTYYPLNNQNNDVQNSEEILTNTNNSSTNLPGSQKLEKQTQENDEKVSLPQTGSNEKRTLFVSMMGLILSLFSIIGITKKVEEKL